MARPAYPSDEVDKLLVRFPPGLRDKIKEAATTGGRSMNSEIVQRLEASFHAASERPAKPDLADFVSVIEDLRASQQRIEALATWQLFDEIQAKFDELQSDPAKKEEFATFLEGVPYFEGIGKHPEIVARRLHQALEREKYRAKVNAGRGSLTKRLAEEEAAAKEPKPD